MTPETELCIPVSIVGQRTSLPEINGNTTSRWNPTPEQIVALEDMYSKGVRTPSADQIQHIATELRKYGKIEGKNVFYWFQNHKARERQKRRRECDNPVGIHTQGVRVSTSSSSQCKKATEGLQSMQRAERAQRRTWTHFPTNGLELHSNNNVKLGIPDTCQNGYSSSLLALQLRGSHESEPKEAQIRTLQLFPLSGENEDKDKELALAPIITPHQFFEFLPLKS